jgi:hypothetical protein
VAFAPSIQPVNTANMVRSHTVRMEEEEVAVAEPAPEPVAAPAPAAPSANYYSSFMHFCDERGDTVRQQHEHHLRAYAEQRRTEIRTRTVTPTPVPQVTVSY